MFRRLICLLAALSLLACPGLAMTREELRSAYRAISQTRSDASPYEQLPDSSGFSSVGALTKAKQAEALAYLNFLRSLAGLRSVSINPLYTLRAQNAALVLSANDQISHSPARPEGMHADLYDSALTGASMSNLACFNWFSNDILIDGVTYFARDDGDMNLSSQSHRRWLLDPAMAETGFGLASADSGNSYVVMYAVDGGNPDALWSYVAWPTAEAFPVELMRDGLAWSLSLNEALYDLDASSPVVYLREQASGAEFIFYPATQVGDGFCAISRDAYGSGDCIIFRPELSKACIDEYLQNQLWEVRVTGLLAPDGSQAEISYTSRMTSLYPQEPVNVEISQLEAALHAGERLSLSAAVIPGYADDLSILWSSSDPAVARVDEDGCVTAAAPGSCTITASSINGRTDSCMLTVEP